MILMEMRYIVFIRNDTDRDNFYSLGLSQFRLIVNVDSSEYQRILIFLSNAFQCRSQTAAIYAPGG